MQSEDAAARAPGRALPAALLLLSLLPLSSCTFGVHRRARFVPPPVPAPSSRPQVSAEDLAKAMAAPPEVTPSDDLSAIEVPETEWPQATVPRRRIVARPRPGSPPVASEDTPQPEVPPTPPLPTTIAPPGPQLGQMLSPEERGRFQARFDQSLARTSRNLAVVRERPLRHADRDTVQRIEAFIAQARALKDTDLQTACSLIERADLLADDLARRLR